MDVLITAADCFTSVGANAEITYFSVRSGLSRLTETGAISRQGTPRVAAVLPGFHHWTDVPRLAALAAESAARALDHAEINGPARIGISLCLPGLPRPDASTSLEPWLLPLRAACEGRRVSATVRGFHEGSASIALAVRDAALRLERGEEDAVLVGGADSRLPLVTLRWLEDRRRLKIGSRAEGLIAGEAASFLVLESPRRRAGRCPPLAQVLASSFAYEPGHHDSDEPCLSVAYAEAIRAALETARTGAVPRTLVSDLNGESYKAKEWAVAEVRALPETPFVHIHPADCFGDVGALAGVTQLLIAALGLSRGEWPVPAMVVCSSEGAGRSVVLVDAIGPGGGRGRVEPNLEKPWRAASARSGADETSGDLVANHLEEAGFLRRQRRLAEARSAEKWSIRDGLDRRHAWHLLALAASAPHAEQALVAAAMDGDRVREDRAAAVAALLLAQTPAGLFALWELVEGAAADPEAAIEAFRDLPQSCRSAVMERLAKHGETSARDLGARLLRSTVADEAALLEAIGLASSPEARAEASGRLLEQGARASRMLLESHTLTGLLPLENIACAAAIAGSHDATSIARRVEPQDVSSRLLQALGGAGAPDAVPLLLTYVSDENIERADAAGAALAALSGVDLVQVAGGDDAAEEVWSRSREDWSNEIARVLVPARGPVRLVRGLPWTPERGEAVLSDPHTRNGVRRALAATARRTGPWYDLTSFYWLQQRAARA